MAKKKSNTAVSEGYVDPNATQDNSDESEYDKPIPKKDPKKKIQEAEDDLNNEIDKNYQMAATAHADWIEAAKEDIDFKSGNQWDEADQVILRQERRPCLTFNQIKPIVKLITGHFIQNNARIQVSPEGAEDQQFSEIGDKVLDHIDENASLDFNLGYQFQGTQTTGQTHTELYLDYEKDPIFGELKSLYHGKPGVILMDPRGSAYDPNEDREFCFKMVKKSKSWLKQKYPAKAAVIDDLTQDSENPELTPVLEGDANNYGANKNMSRIGLNQVNAEQLLDLKQKQFHVKEYWRFKYIEKVFVFFLDSGNLKRFDSDKEAQDEIDKRREQYINDGKDPAQWAPLKRTRMIKEMHVAIRCGGKIMADGISPFEPYYSGFPFFPAIADWTPEADKLQYAVQGIVRTLKDPQREVNKSRSQLLHIINTSANAGWIKDENAMDPNQEDNLKNFGSTPGVILTVKDGKRLERIEPVGVPAAQMVREKAGKDSFKETSGVNSDLLAIDESGNPSGKAIALRIRQAITILEPDFKNFRLTKKLIGVAIMRMVPTLFDVAKLKKVLGQNFMQVNQLDDTKLKTWLIQIEDLKYNVRIAEQGDTKTLREETFEDLMNMMSNGMPIPFDVMADFMTLPNKTEVMAKINAYQQQQSQQALQMAQATGKAPGQGPAPKQRKR